MADHLVPGSGTSMECTGFLQGFYSGRDLNMGVHGGAQPPCNNERMFKSGYYYNVFVPSLSRDQFLVHDKEILRRTILKHDLVFRDQVSELHRLYRRQRELMDEIRRAELVKQNLQLQRSQSNSLSDQRQWQTPGLPWVNLAASRPSISTAKNFQSTSSFSERKSTRAELNTVLAEANLEERKLWHSKSKKKMLDLELPADEYIDSEEEDLCGKEKASKGPELPCYLPQKLPEDSRKSDLKLFPCSNLLNSICHGGCSRPDPFFRRTNDLVDLNEPVWLKAAAASNPVSVVGSGTFQQGRDAETCLKTTYHEDKQGELLPNCDEYGSSAGTLSIPCKRLKVKLPAEFPTANPLDDCERILQDQVADSVGEKSERNASLSDDDYRQQVSPCLPTSCRLVPRSDGVKSEPFSSCPKPTHYANQNPIAVPALPRFNSVFPSYMSTESSSGSPLLNGNWSDCSRNMNGPGVGSFSPPQNSHWFGSLLETTRAASLPSIGFHHSNYDTATVHMNCFQRSAARDPNSTKIMDLNMPPDVETANVVEKIEESQDTLIVPREKLDYGNTPNEEKEALSQIDLVSSQACSTSVSHAGPKRLKTWDCAGDEKILVSDSFDQPGVCTYQFPHLSSSSNFHPDASEEKNTQSSLKAGMVNGYSASSPPAISGKLCTADNVSVDIMADTKLSGLGNQIDLNSCIIENEPLPTVKVKNAIEIDLEAPVSPENKECSPPRGDSEENQLDTHFQLSEMEDRDLKNELVRMAAEAIVLISAPSSGKLLVENAVFVCHPDGSPSHSLHWFAGIVSSFGSDLQNEVGATLGADLGGNQHELSSDHESGYFEAMAMEFTDAELEEYLCKSNELKQEERDPLSPTKQSKRARSRRGRQRKDFQTEVLPSLATLSRHEVAEDLQTIVVQMEAAGIPTESMSGRRNAGRCLRARRRSGNSFYDWMDNAATAYSESKQQTNGTELAFEERRLKGWGKINRRRRGPRMPASNPLHTFN